MTSEVTRRGFLQGAAVSSALGTLTPVSSVAREPQSVARVTQTEPAFQNQLSVTMKVNGRVVIGQIEARTTLLDWLRERAGLTGTKKGCNEGACGACTVLIDGKRMNSCLTLVAQCDYKEITTIEGIAGEGGQLHPVQQAFIDHDAFQCGYCTSGQIVSAVACINEGHATDAANVREWMSGNICRCSAYPQITAAVLDAANRVKGS